jgi:hypothetical protein
MKINSRYKILSPEGFVDFKGVQKLKKQTREIFFDNGLTLRASYNHKIYSYDGDEILIRDIKIGDNIKSHDGYFVVNKIEDYDFESDVYDIIDSGESHLYYTNNVISHNCNFLGSGDNVIDSGTMEKIKKNDILEPRDKMMGGALWVWEDPILDHKYIMGVDVSRGDSEDFTTFNIVDFDTREQVVEFLDKVPPDIAAEIALKWAQRYNAFVVIDITGGMGVSTARKMQELGYKNLYIDGQISTDIWKYDPKAQEKIPGINFNNKRVQIIATFEEYIRHGFKIKSSRLYNELLTFVYINGRPDHIKGQHDDLIMSVAMALYVGESSFSKLTKVTEQAKVMIDSWTVNESVKYKTDFMNPSVPSYYGQSNNDSKKSYNQKDVEKYLWLFGGMRR